MCSSDLGAKMASPTSSLGTSARPSARRSSSTCCASRATASASTGRPWQALLTPLITFAREKGSTTPERLQMLTWVDSEVLNLFPQAAHSLRRRTAHPSSDGRESTTRDNESWQNGHLMTPPPFRPS